MFEALIQKLEAAVEWDEQLDREIEEAIDGDGRRLGWGPYPYTSKIDAARGLLDRVLPGWSYRVARCAVSDDAWVMPDFNCPVHGERLRNELRQDIDWTDFTDVDLRPSGREATALCISILKALEIINAKSHQAPEAAPAEAGSEARSDGETSAPAKIGTDGERAQQEDETLIVDIRSMTDKWPPVKKAIWDVVVVADLNGGKYINSWDLTEKLFAAVQSSVEAALEKDLVAKVVDDGLGGIINNIEETIAGSVVADVAAEREVIAQEARRYAGHYPEASDGRNTFIMFAEYVESRQEVPLEVFTIGEKTMSQVFRPAGLTNLNDLQAVLDAVEKALSDDEPVAAMTTDYLGCEYVSMDVAGIEKIAASGSQGATEVVYLYDKPQQPAPSVAVKAGDAAAKLQRALDAASPNHKTMWVYVDDLRAALSAQVQDVAKGQLFGPYAHLNGNRHLAEDEWAVEDNPIKNTEEYFSIPLYASVEPPFPSRSEKQEPVGKPLDLTITKEWFEKRAELEGDHDIGAGRRKLTASIDPTPTELAELHRLAHRIPEGWQLVPIEPTVWMLDAGVNMDWRRGHDTMRGIWKAMLTAAPGTRERA